MLYTVIVALVQLLYLLLVFVQFCVRLLIDVIIVKVDSQIHAHLRKFPIESNQTVTGYTTLDLQEISSV